VTDIDVLLEALLPRLRDVLDDRQVLDGWDRETDLDERVVVVMFAPTPGRPVMSSTLSPDGEGFGSVETVSIACTAASWDGEMDYAGKRGQVMADLRAVRALLAAESRANARLGGLITSARLGTEGLLYQEVDERGATVQADFTIVLEVHGP
jgi:hypothetical protein